jgi:hypothetical protein
MHHCCGDGWDGDIDRHSCIAIDILPQILHLIPSPLFARMVTNATMTVIRTAIMTLGIIPAAITHVPMTRLRFLGTELGTKTTFLTIRSSHLPLKLTESCDTNLL